MLRREETEKIREHYNADPKKEWDRLQIRYTVEKFGASDDRIEEKMRQIH